MHRLAKVVAFVFAVCVLALPLRAQALVDELVGDEVCADVMLPMLPDEGRCVPLEVPLIDLPF